MNFIRFKLASLIFGLALLVNACGPAALDSAAISTAAAQTVEARFIKMAENTVTPKPTLKPTNTSYVSTPTATSTVISTPPESQSGPPCLSANFLSENYPDGTIVKPGEIFTKTWRVKNSGSCTWDSDYLLIFWDGDALGTAYSYPLPQTVYPEQEVDISIPFTAPATDGTYRSEWMIQTKWLGTLGVGEYQAPLYVQIFVSSSPKPKYSVTSVSYSIERDPLYGCPANVTYTIYATITVNGPLEVSYYWLKSDGTQEASKNIEFKEAGSKNVSVSWQLHRGAHTNPRWVMLVMESPIKQEFGKANFTYDCQ